MGTQQVQNTYGLDLEVFRGSSPNLDDLNDLEPEVLREGDGEASPLDTSAEIVMVIGGNVEEMAGLELDEIEEESIPDLTLGTQSSDYGNDSLGLSLELEEVGEDWFGEDRTDRKVMLSPNGALEITRKFSGMESPLPALTLVSPLGDIKIERVESCGEASGPMVSGAHGDWEPSGESGLSRDDMDISVRLAILEQEVASRLSHAVNKDPVMTKEVGTQVDLVKERQFSSSPLAPMDDGDNQVDQKLDFEFGASFNSAELKIVTTRPQLRYSTKVGDSYGGVKVSEFGDGVAVRVASLEHGEGVGAASKFEFDNGEPDGEQDGAAVSGGDLEEPKKF